MTRSRMSLRTPSPKDRKPGGRKAARQGGDPGPAMKTVTLKQSQFIPAPPASVYNAFLDPKAHTAFTGFRATVERREGGTCTAGDGYIIGKYLRLQNGRRILQEWKTKEWPAQAPPSLLELRFVPREDGTEVVMTQSNVPAFQASRYRRGWVEHYWNPLRKYFSGKQEGGK